MEALSKEDLTPWEKALTRAVNGEHGVSGSGEYSPTHRYISRLTITFYKGLTNSTKKSLRQDTNIDEIATYLADRFLIDLGALTSTKKNQEPLGVRLTALRQRNELIRGGLLYQDSTWKNTCAKSIMIVWDDSAALFKYMNS